MSGWSPRCADDYLTKPFDLGELVARLRALLRRRPVTGGGATVQVGAVVIDPVGHRVTAGGEPVELTKREFELLAMLARHPEMVLGREQILPPSGATTSAPTPMWSTCSSPTCGASWRRTTSPGWCTRCAGSVSCCGTPREGLVVVAHAGGAGVGGGGRAGRDHAGLHLRGAVGGGGQPSAGPDGLDHARAGRRRRRTVPAGPDHRGPRAAPRSGGHDRRPGYRAGTGPGRAGTDRETARRPRTGRRRDHPDAGQIGDRARRDPSGPGECPRFRRRLRARTAHPAHRDAHRPAGARRSRPARRPTRRGPGRRPRRREPGGVLLIVTNAVANAVHHGGATEIAVAARRAGTFVEITVDDNGTGLPNHLAATAFDRFVKRPGSPGSGLGLALVRQQAELHGGTAELTDSPLGGARLWVRLPAESS